MQIKRGKALWTGSNPAPQENSCPDFGWFPAPAGISIDREPPRMSRKPLLLSFLTLDSGKRNREYF